MAPSRSAARCQTCSCLTSSTGRNHDCPMRDRLPVASATVLLSLSLFGNHRHPKILPPCDPAASIKNAVPEMVRLPAGSRARSSPVHGCARNVIKCRWIHPLRTDGERAITAIFVRVSLAGSGRITGKKLWLRCKGCNQKEKEMRIFTFIYEL